MQKLRERHGVATVLAVLRFLSIRLRSRPETSDLAQAVEQTRGKLRDKSENYAEAREMRVAASAEIVYRDSELDAAMAGLVRSVLVKTQGRRDHEMYVKLFPQSPSVLMLGQADNKQDVFVKTVLDILRNDAQFADFAAEADSLERSSTALQQAVEQRDALYVPESHASADLRVAMDQAKRVYNLAYPRLQLLFPNQRGLVESFFADLSAKSAASNHSDIAEPQDLSTADINADNIITTTGDDSVPQ